MIPDISGTSHLELGAAATEDGKSAKPNKPAPEPPLASDGLVTWSLVGDQKQESIKYTIHGDDGIRATEASFNQEDKRTPVDLEDFQDGGKYRSIVRIESRWGGERTAPWTLGTGWLVREDLVITAGRNVFSAAHRCQASHIQCWVGYRGGSFIDESSEQYRSALNVVTTKSWLRQHSDRDRRDLALIQVDKPFAGNLRLFKYIQTPTAKKEGTIIVVGYPGDEHLETFVGETSLWMCEARQKANYDLHKSANHMIEYNMDIYGGQSGAPILFSDHTGTVVIGTHCYGGTGEKVNSGSLIGGEYGNNYEEFIKRVELSKREEPYRLGGFQPKFAHPESQLDSYYTEFSSSSRSGGINDFWAMLNRVKEIGLYPPGGGENLTLGPVGWLMGTIAGGMIGLLSATAEAASQEKSDYPPTELFYACACRAQLAEAAFQCVMRLTPSEGREKIMLKMQDYWVHHLSWLPFDILSEPHLLAQLSPIFDDFGFRLAVSQWQKDVSANPEVKPLGQEFLKLKDLVPVNFKQRGDELLWRLSRMPARFVHNVDQKNVESAAGWLADVLKAAIRVAKPIVSESASRDLRRIVDAMGEVPWLYPDTISQEMSWIVKRAVVADIALQVLEGLDLRTLGELTVMPRGTELEWATANFTTIIQQMGPKPIIIAEISMIRHFRPIFYRLKDQTIHPPGGKAVTGSAVAKADEAPGEPHENGNKTPAHSPTAVPEIKNV
ncbi:Serine/cysteine peptidase, trypsin-like protein [Cordyceps militaris CM01]|uniref:Serine protease n=1 Tax=Cordyceps militaris (strain CM01) TaxID=983644 RepID=G3JSX9_CORMM|nr:Serine/cysteine peptidase, trypsin-like protein [Cordyceps militaris CM01]EGX88975.1 Serine/cysteine peptidase, trypsin-like protein [Cordyceps militaris CM01]